MVQKNENGGTFRRVVDFVILLNAVTLGLETYSNVMKEYGTILHWIDLAFISFFAVELFARVVAGRRAFFLNSWNVFDFVVVAVTILPFLGIPGLGNVSAFRAIRLLRLLSSVYAFRHVLRAIVKALEGSFAVMCVLALMIYVYSVISVHLFGDTDPEHFENLHIAAFTFFQIMTLDAWTDIVRPLMGIYPLAGWFFISFIVITVFVLLSIIIAVAAEAINHSKDDESEEEIRITDERLQSLIGAAIADALSKIEEGRKA